LGKNHGDGTTANLKDKYKPKKALKNFELFCEQGDGCNWKLAVPPEEVRDWHNKPCPRCGRGVIVSDSDLAEFEKLRPKE